LKTNVSARPADLDVEPAIAARRWILGGRVQGVGFRPFVYRLAKEYGLRGWVCNAAAGVEVVAEGPPALLENFAHDLLHRAPPFAHPGIHTEESIPPPRMPDFRIRDSEADGEAIGIAAGVVPPDQGMCPDCLAEMRDPAARRHQYPFINCTQCGPRYTVIRALPYDRRNTSLAEFPLCAPCAREYGDPLDRRFHAQPLACPHCGPSLRWRAGEWEIGDGPAALAAAVSALRRGLIVAVRGVGGYHLMCDAANAAAVEALRLRKHRPDKPLALMVPVAGADGLTWVRRLAELTSAEAAALKDPARPIVLLPARRDGPFLSNAAPRLAHLGVMLPYSPLHHLLLERFSAPLIATSANLSAEPVLTDPADAEQRLNGVADAFLHHNRSIVRPADDPVARLIAGGVRPLRLGRGNAPLELKLPRPLARPVLALGAYSKTTVALAWDDRVIVSPHIGTMSGPRTRRLLHEVAGDLQQLYGVRAESVACDAHPDFPSHRWARDCGLPVIPVLHHHAHAAALTGEFSVQEPMLCFTWDGVGYGADGTLWGGEALWGMPGCWRRVASWRPLRLPGGGRAARQPWRAALALCWQTGRHWPGAPADLDPRLRTAFDASLGTTQTSAVGRLFDAAAALLGLAGNTSYEAQAPMQLEALAAGTVLPPIAMPQGVDPSGMLRSDWEPLLTVLLDEGSSRAERAAIFHASLAQALVEQAIALRAGLVFSQVGLCGGVFQNRLLTETVQSGLMQQGFATLIPRRLPMNDASISFGQIIEAAARGGAP
jgi:hydrogenase maturation protein HypF